jgi:TolA-binding protein
MKRLLVAWSLCLVAALSGCVYYNTFFHAKQAYQEAEKVRLTSHQEFMKAGAGAKYNEAIKKASAVLQNHPKSKYADDALLLIAKSFYYTGEFARCREKCVELSGVFRDSKLIPEARFYQGMSEYYLDNTEKALTMLRDMAEKADDRALRERASFMLARIPFEEERYDEALPELANFIDKFGGSEYRLRADSMRAAAYWETERFDSAGMAYEVLYDRAVDPELKFAAMFRQGESKYRLGDLDGGLKIFHGLEKDEKYFTHKPIVQYEIAMGLLSLDSVDQALEIFRRLPEEAPKTEAAARSLFALGDIYQTRGDSLAKAQEYFQEVPKVWADDQDFLAAAMERAREITQLLALQKDLTSSDSSGYAESHFLLGELFLRQLDNPDSALEEFRLVVDDYSESEYAPLAMLNLAEVALGPLSDSTMAQGIWQALVARYPGAEASILARRKLGWPPPEDITQSDILLMYGAESMLFDEHNPDSALALYDLLVTSFPESPLVPQAYYAQAWILDTYHAREDSVVYRAYEQVARGFPGTPYAEAAQQRLNPTPRVVRNMVGEQPEVTRRDTLYTDTSANKTTIADMADTVRTAPVPLEEGVFDYPVVPNFTWPTAVTVVFKIRINDQGRVGDDLELIGSSGYKEIDEKARTAMLQTRFDPQKLDAFLTLTREWYKYSFLIPPPGKTKEEYQQNPNTDPFQNTNNPFSQP